MKQEKPTILGKHRRRTITNTKHNRPLSIHIWTDVARGGREYGETNQQRGARIKEPFGKQFNRATGTEADTTIEGQKTAREV
jgi:hypothetical protein